MSAMEFEMFKCTKQAGQKGPKVRRKLFDPKSLFFRIGIVIGAAGFVLTLGLASLYDKEAATMGLRDADSMQNEMIYIISGRLVQDLNRNVTRRVTVAM